MVALGLRIAYLLNVLMTVRLGIPYGVINIAQYIVSMEKPCAQVIPILKDVQSPTNV
jgi:hypothetical protein